MSRRPQDHLQPDHRQVGLADAVCGVSLLAIVVLILGVLVRAVEGYAWLLGYQWRGPL